MVETLFIQLAELDCEAEPLNGLFYVDCSSESPEMALEKFIKNKGKVGSSDFSFVYSAGNYGNPDHVWLMSRCELYKNIDSTSNPVVIVYYNNRASSKIDNVRRY